MYKYNLFQANTLAALENARKIFSPPGRKLNGHKTLRRRPERPLTVLCMFNLLPVPRGQKTFAPEFIFMAVCEKKKLKKNCLTDNFLGTF